MKATKLFFPGNRVSPRYGLGCVALVSLSSLLILPGCGDGEDSGSISPSLIAGNGGQAGAGGSSGGAAGQGGNGGGGGGNLCMAEDPPPVPSEERCARLPGGPAGTSSLPIDLSAVHALVRFFAPIQDVLQIDEALVKSLQKDASLKTVDLEAYVAGTQDVACNRSANPKTSLDPVQMEMRGDTVWIRPGTGQATLPAGAKSVVVDLRDLPDVPSLRAALEKAVGLAMSTNVPRLSQQLRAHYGFTDEAIANPNVYSQSIKEVPQEPIVAQGQEDLRLALVTGPELAPEAAELAITLRLAQRAWIVGEDVRADVAESRWQGVGNKGVYVRIKALALEGKQVPDVLPADRRSSAPECVVEEVLGQGATPPKAAQGAANRPNLAVVNTFGKKKPKGESLAETQAAMILAHGTLRRFFPYFPVVGDVVDERLLEVLGSLQEPLNRKTIRQNLRRFLASIQDGHGFVADLYGVPPKGFLPLFLEEVNGEPVVRHSKAPGINPGDTLVSMQGVPFTELLATELARTSAASPGYRFMLAVSELLQLDGPVELVLRDPQGSLRTHTANPQPVEDYAAVSQVASLRPAGYLTDLGAPSLYYINLSDQVLSSMQDFEKALQEANGSQGLVLDMRGYPGVDIYEIARHIILKKFSSPIYLTPIRIGPELTEVDEIAYAFNPSNPYPNPIALIVGTQTVSAAETFSTMLVDAKRVTVVGKPSAATNGNITALLLPAGFAVTFTGMDVRFADGNQSVFHGVGIVPQVPSTFSAQSFAKGIDPELMDAIQVLSKK